MLPATEIFAPGHADDIVARRTQNSRAGPRLDEITGGDLDENERYGPDAIG
jgi:hypothetical protein